MNTKTQLPATEKKTELSLSDMFASIVDLAKNPDVDPGKMQAFVDLQTNMMDRAAQSEFKGALARARLKMPRISKDGAITNHKTGAVQSRYATYEAIDQIVRPLIEAEGLTYGFNYNEGEQGRVLVTCIVSHITNGFEEKFGPMPLSIDTTGSKNATQGAGSAGKYGQRYTLCAAFNIVTEGVDVDGASAKPSAGSGALEAQLEAVGHAADSAAQAGSYEAFWNKCTGIEKGWLVDTGKHAELK